MAKYINTRTGLEVPANEVRELTPGSGVYVHVATVGAVRVESSPPVAEGGGEGDVRAAAARGIRTPFGTVYPGDASAKIVRTAKQVLDAYVVKLGDGETYNPATHNPFNKRLAG